mmetsp:Transcript_97520/g.183377  ORF Transcript_97520/g.183377 Transcript_97520/m.183377 type:complete len:257 (-) Transcript_97520:419-1189(-)
MPAPPGAAPAASSHQSAEPPSARSLAKVDRAPRGEAQAAPGRWEKARKRVPRAQLPRVVWPPLTAQTAPKASRQRRQHRSDCKASREHQAFFAATRPWPPVAQVLMEVHQPSCHCRLQETPCRHDPCGCCHGPPVPSSCPLDPWEEHPCHCHHWDPAKAPGLAVADWRDCFHFQHLYYQECPLPARSQPTYPLCRCVTAWRKLIRPFRLSLYAGTEAAKIRGKDRTDLPSYVQDQRRPSRWPDWCRAATRKAFDSH